MGTAIRKATLHKQAHLPFQLKQGSHELPGSGGGAWVGDRSGHEGGGRVGRVRGDSASPNGDLRPTPIRLHQEQPQSTLPSIPLPNHTLSFQEMLGEGGAAEDGGGKVRECSHPVLPPKRCL